MQVVRLVSFVILCCWLLVPVAYGLAEPEQKQAKDNTQSRLGDHAEKIASVAGVPWGMTFIHDSDMLVTTRGGNLFRLDIKNGTQQPVSGLPDIRVSGQGGLLDVAKLPDSDWVYFTYSENTPAGQGVTVGVTVLARAQLTASHVQNTSQATSPSLQLNNWQVLLRTQSASDSDRHYGSRIAFDGAGHVFFSIGDRGVRDNGQDLTTHAGTIVRLTLDGGVPADNPFITKTVDGVKPLPEIWSYGHRNPQGLFFDAATQTLWAIEHGPRGGDEINLIKKGANYGWAVVSHGKEYWGPFDVGEATSKPGMEDPVKVFTPSIAPSGLVRYRGDVYPQWQGAFFAGALKLTHVNSVMVNDKGQALSETRLFESLEERVRNVIQGPDGFLYFATDRGDIYRIE